MSSAAVHGSPTICPEPHDAPALTRVEDLWFDDGSLVIQAGNKIFRVFRSILVSHSTFFRNLVSIPQPLSTDVYEGCQKIILQDSPDDVYHFLKTIFDANYFSDCGADKFDVAKAVLLLSHKYQLPNFKRRSLLVFLKYHPLELSDVNSIRTTISDSEFYRRKAIFGSVELARETECEFLLPHIYAIISTYSLESIVGYRNNPSNLGNKDDVSRVVLGQAEIRKRLQIVLLESLLSDNCSEPGCRGKRDYLLQRALGKEMRCFHLSWIPIMNSHEVSSFVGQLKDLIPHYACRSAFLQDLRVAARDLWNDLPSIFGLDDWDILKARYREEMGIEAPQAS